MERTDFEQWKSKEVARLLALVETERRYYQEMVAGLPAPVVVLGADRSIVSANRAFRLAFGVSSEDLQRLSIEQVVPSEQLVEAIRESHVHGLATPTVNIESKGRQLRVGLVPLRKWDDETELETLLLIEPAGGSFSSAPAPAVLDLPVIVWQADAATLTFKSVTGSAGGLFGYTLAHWKETAGFFAERIYREDRDSTIEFFKQAIEHGGDATAEYRVQSALGEIVWCRETIRVAEPGAASITGVASDITRRRQLEEQLLTAGRSEALHSLAARLAHDLNNPLMVVNGYGEEILSSIANNLGADHPMRGDMEQVLSAAERMSGVTSQLLAYTRKHAEEPQPLNLARALAEMEEKLAQAAGGSVAVEVQRGPEDIWGFATAPQFEHVMQALISPLRDDARDRTRVVIACEADVLMEKTDGATLKPGAYARVSVRDNGRGLDAPQVGAVFESFVTKDPAASAGPALARAYSIVRDWGGDIAFSSLPFRGSTFTVYLPLANAPAVAAVAPPVAAEPAKPPNPTILVVEDEAGIRSLVRKILMREGYNVLEAGTGEEAIALGQSHSVQLLVTDVMLGSMNGRDLAEQMHTEQPALKVLYVSGYTDDANVLAAKFPPGARFLQKPFTLSALVGQVRAALGIPPTGAEK